MDDNLMQETLPVSEGDAAEEEETLLLETDREEKREPLEEGFFQDLDALMPQLLSLQEIAQEAGHPGEIFADPTVRTAALMLRESMEEDNAEPVFASLLPIEAGEGKDVLLSITQVVYFGEEEIDEVEEQLFRWQESALCTGGILDATSQSVRFQYAFPLPGGTADLSPAVFGLAVETFQREVGAFRSAG